MAEVAGSKPLLLCMYQLMYYPLYQHVDAGGTWYLVPLGKVFAQGGICCSHVIIFVFYCLLPCHEFPDQVPGYQVPVIR